MRQKKYICQNYMEVEAFHISSRIRPFRRSKKIKESTPAQRNLNEKKKQRFFVRLVHLNFFRKDMYVDLTYDKKNIPETRTEILRDIKNYINRLRRWRKKHGLPPLKYIYVISNCDQNGNKVRYHVHMIINNMDRDVAEQKWNKGYVNAERLQFNEYGVEGKSLYMMRQAKGDRSWGCSLGLKKPEAIVSDNKITGSIARKIERNPEDREFFEKLYPGWTFTDCIVHYPEDCNSEDDNKYLNGVRFLIRMRRYE